MVIAQGGLDLAAAVCRLIDEDADDVDAIVVAAASVVAATNVIIIALW